MKRNFCIPAILMLWSCVASARADGLVFQLPADGSWAAYDAETDAEMTPPNTPTQVMKLKSTVTVSSVGRIDRFDQPSRWIEIRIENPPQPGIIQKIVLKMLVPEQYLARGQDPLAHGIKTYFSKKDVDEKAGKTESFIDDGFNRIQYEIDRLRNVFPPPLANAHSLPRRTLNAAGREWRDCEVIQGTNHYDGPLLGEGRMVYDGKYRLTLNPEAPFGLVAMEMETAGKEYSRGGIVQTKSAGKLILSETGGDAVSELTTGDIQLAPPIAIANPIVANRAPEIVESANTLAAIEKSWRAGDEMAFGKLVLYANPTVEKATAEMVHKKSYPEIRLQAAEWKSEGPVVCSVTRFIMTPNQAASIRPANFFFRRDGRWRMLGGEIGAAKDILTADEQAAVRTLARWAEDWKAAHPDAPAQNPPGQ